MSLGSPAANSVPYAAISRPLVAKARITDHLMYPQHSKSLDGWSASPCMDQFAWRIAKRPHTRFALMAVRSALVTMKHEQHRLQPYFPEILSRASRPCTCRHAHHRTNEVVDNSTKRRCREPSDAATTIQSLVKRPSIALHGDGRRGVLLSGTNQPLGPSTMIFNVTAVKNIWA